MWLLELRNGSQLQITGKAQTISERDLINVTFATSDIQPNLAPGGWYSTFILVYGCEICKAENMGLRTGSPKNKG